MTDVETPPTHRTETVSRVLAAISTGTSDNELDREVLQVALASEGRSLLDLPEVGLWLALTEMARRHRQKKFFQKGLGLTPEQLGEYGRALMEIHGDSMLPMESGSIVICSYVENLRDIKKDRTYVVISKSEGLVYKRLIPDHEQARLMLISDNDTYLPYHLGFEDVDEVWQYYAHLSFSDSRHVFHQILEDKLHDIQKKLSEVHKVVVG